jgi:uncharacterized membrane protein
MKTDILNGWLKIRASYWFVPSLMAFSAILGAIVVVGIDRSLEIDWPQQLSWLSPNHPAVVRALLTTIAGSMITVAGVTFSMTLLAVSHASAQIGPRLLSSFMRDRGNQITLGTFIATFLYCLMVLQTVHEAVNQPGSTQAAFVPHLATLIALIMAVLSVMVLIYFIHHVPQSINVANVVANVGDEIIKSIQSLYPERSDSGESASASADSDADAADSIRERPGDPASLALDNRAGYLRLVDFEQLVSVSADNDLQLELLQRPGEFVVPGQALMRIWPDQERSDEVAQSLLDAFSWGDDRTRQQDVLFPVEQLMEILGKALSPGINGQFTALLCLNQFERAVTEILNRNEPECVHYDSAGTLRVACRPVSQQEFIEEVFLPIRQYTAGDWITSRHLLKMLKRLSGRFDSGRGASLLNIELSRIQQAVADSESATPQ